MKAHALSVVLAVMTAIAVIALTLAAPALGATSLHWSAPVPTDTAPASQPSVISCPSEQLCVGTDGIGTVFTTTDPGSTTRWSRADALPVGGPDQLLVCPSTTLCLATDDANVVSSTTPATATQWQPEAIGTGMPGEQVAGLACPSSQLCVAIESDLAVATSTDPDGGAEAWAHSQISPAPDYAQVTNVSCPTTGLCVFAANAGGDTNAQVYWSTDPSGGGSSWQNASLGTRSPFDDVDCPSAELCLAVGGDGTLLASTNPTGGAGTWHVVYRPVNTHDKITQVSCATVTSCLAVTDTSAVLSSTNPTGGNRAWTTRRPLGTNAGYAGVTCPLSDTCMLSGDPYDLDTSAAGLAEANSLQVSPAPSPTTPVPHWSLVQDASVPEGFQSIACPSADLCAATDQIGQVLTSTDPSSAKPAWKLSTIDTQGIVNGITCPSTRLCLVFDSTGHVIRSIAPATANWSSTLVDTADGGEGGVISAVGCASPTLCWAADPGDGVDDSGGWWQSPAPSAGKWMRSGAWDLGSVHSGNIVDGVAIACASATLCVGTGTNAAGTKVETDVWRAGHPGATLVGAVGGGYASCAGPTLCVVANIKDLSWSTHPATPGSWHTIALEGPHTGDLSGLDCPSTSLCLASDSRGRVAVSTDPAAAKPTWRFTDIDATVELESLSCASAQLCLAVDARGNVLVAKP